MNRGATVAENKRFYWIKLKTDFFNQGSIDFLMSQENGCEYIVLYQMLCLQTANNGGELSARVGEMLVPYDIKKIVRDTKYFDADTVIVALELFKKLGLVYEQNDKVLKIADYDEMVGSSASDDHTKRLGAERQRRFREKQKQLSCNATVTEDLTLNSNVEKEIEYRDKSIDIEKDIDIEIDENKGNANSNELDTPTKKAKKPKHKYGEYNHVLLTDKDYNKLCDEYGDMRTGSAIRYLDEYIQMSGKRYKDHYLVLKKWVFDAVDERERKQSKQQSGGIDWSKV